MAVTVIGNKLKVEVLADESTKTQLNDIQQKVSDLDSRVDTILTTPAESVSAQEIIDARDGEISLGAKIGKIDERQSQNGKNIGIRSAYGSHFNQTIRPLVTLIDDDGNNAVLTTLKTIADDYNIKIGVAVNNTSQIITDIEKRQQLLNLQNDYGWEVLSHTMNHTFMGDMTLDEIEGECKLFLKTFNEYGFDIFNIVYPFSMPNDNVAKMVSKYYSAGFGTGANYNTITNMNEYNIYRINIGANYESFNNKTLQEYKDIVDEVILNNGWLVLMLHIGETDANGVQLIRDVLDYVVSNNIEIVTPTDGLRVFGSVTQSGLINQEHFLIKSNGNVVTNKYAMEKRVTRLETDPPETTQGTSNKNISFVSGWSLGTGILEEYVASNGYQYQEFTTSGTIPKKYIRKWVGSSWRRWNNYAILDERYQISITGRVIPANSSVDVGLFQGNIVASSIYIANPVGLPEAGIVWSVYSHTDTIFRIRLANVTNSDITIETRLWNVVGIIAL